MALHRDIYWVGRQWAVTGYGIQACNQKQKGKFDIEGARLWEDGVLESLRAEAWLNIEDFEKALEVARKHYPEPPRKAVPLEQSVAGLKETPVEKIANKEIAAEVPKPAAQKFELRIEAWPARFVRPAFAFDGDRFQLMEAARRLPFAGLPRPPQPAERPFGSTLPGLLQRRDKDKDGALMVPESIERGTCSDANSLHQ